LASEPKPQSFIHWAETSYFMVFLLGLMALGSGPVPRPSLYGTSQKKKKEVFKVKSEISLRFPQDPLRTPSGPPRESKPDLPPSL
jgi:hypothetical protein